MIDCPRCAKPEDLERESQAHQEITLAPIYLQRRVRLLVHGIHNKMWRRDNKSRHKNMLFA
jgi:hypothetical protein